MEGRILVVTVASGVVRSRFPGVVAIGVVADDLLQDVAAVAIVVSIHKAELGGVAVLVHPVAGDLGRGWIHGGVGIVAVAVVGR